MRGGLEGRKDMRKGRTGGKKGHEERKDWREERTGGKGGLEGQKDWKEGRSNENLLTVQMSSYTVKLHTQISLYPESPIIIYFCSLVLQIIIVTQASP